MEAARADPTDAAHTHAEDAQMADGDAATGSRAGEASETATDDSVYMLLDLDALGTKQGPLQPGAVIELEGLSTFEPRVQLEDGTSCPARHDETIGTCMLFAERQPASLASADAKPVLDYLGKTERIIKVGKPS